VDSVGELFAIFTNGEGSINLLTLALAPLQAALSAIKFVIDAIIVGLKIIGVGKGSAVTTARDKAAADAGYGGGSYINPMNAGGTSTNLTTTTNLYLDRAVVATSTNTYLGNQSTSSTAPRINRRGP
jgi:hypothetical protein